MYKLTWPSQGHLEVSNVGKFRQYNCSHIQNSSKGLQENLRSCFYMKMKQMVLFSTSLR